MHTSLSLFVQLLLCGIVCATEAFATEGKILLGQFPFLPIDHESLSRVVLRQLPTEDLRHVRLVNRAARDLVWDDPTLSYWQEWFLQAFYATNESASEKLELLYTNARFARHVKKLFYVKVDETLTGQLLAHYDALFLKEGITFGLKGNITGLPLQPLKTLTSLDLSGLHLSSLEPLDFPTRLKHLDLKNNRLDNVRKVESLPFLESLDVSQNFLVALSKVPLAATLRDLNLASNHLHIEEGMAWPRQLVVLNLGHNEIISVRGWSFGNVLEELYLEHNQITFDAEVEHGEVHILSNRLRILDVNYNPLKTLQPLLLPDGLEVLIAKGTRVTTIDNVFFPPTLQKVSLDDNQLTSIDALAPCVHLKVLEASGNQVTSTGVLSRFAEMEDLFLGHNNITDFRDVVFSRVLRKVYLSGNRIPSLDLLNLPSTLTVLVAFNCGMTVANHLAKLVSLTYVGLGRNQLRMLPCLTNLVDLATLDVSENQLTNIQFIEPLTSLKVFRARANQINSVKVQFPQKTRIVELADNRLLSVFGAKWNDEIEILDLSDNSIVALILFRAPRNLKILDLSSTNLITLAGALIPSSVRVEVHDTPLSSYTLNSFVNAREPRRNSTIHVRVG